VPNFLSIYGNVHISTILTVFLFGAGWGLANVGFGIGLSTLGLALGTAIVLGLNNAIGAILPIILYTPEEFTTPAGFGITAGVIVMILGIIVCANAGAQKEKALKKRAGTNGKSNQFTKGLIICIIAGFCGAMFNFALIAGKPLEEIAIKQGAPSLHAANPTWVISLAGGFSVTLLFCLYLLRKNKTMRAFTSPGTKRYWLITLIMGAMWFGGVAIYGTAVSKLGKLGPSIGWPLIQSMAVLSGNVVGIISGEWKGSGTKPLRIMLAGLGLLVVGISFVSYAGTL
jgi:L-rhamnose-H+ transport protein